MNWIIRAAVGAASLAMISGAPARASALFTEGFETPDVPSHFSAPNTVPSGWEIFSHPALVSIDDGNPLPAPAEGNQFLRLAGVNTGIARVTSVKISANTIYTLSAATAGPDLKWSLQLWADSNASSHFEGSGFDTFIGQQYAENPGAQTGPGAQWKLNHFSFNSADYASLVGQNLVIFLNNYGEPYSYYDNVKLSNSGGTGGVPEPGSWSLMLGGFGVAGAMLRRRARAVAT